MRRWAAPGIAILLIAACTSDGDRPEATSRPDTTPRGGTLRIAIPDFTNVLNLDPQRSYWGAEWGLFRCCLLRTLYSYNGKPTEEGGGEPRPDLAVGSPVVSADGLTWTFRLKQGLRYAPPYEDTPITAPDVVRALERDARIKADDYSDYYSVIRGFDDYAAGDADSISGLETPDDWTLVVRLERVTGDLAYRFSLAATAPIPEGAADGHDEDYGRFVVASGPYMIEGSRELDFSVPPDEQEPAEGFVPAVYTEAFTAREAGSLVLERNPSWDPDTDRIRAAYADRIEITIGGPEEEIARRVDMSKVDFVFAANSPYGQVARYLDDNELEDRVYVHPDNAFWSVTMNLAVPPFDDVHVRRAVALAIDRGALVELLSEPPYGPFGQSWGEVATHMATDAFEGRLLRAFDPYPFDPDAARVEMRASAYDRNLDGRCDAEVCRNVRVLVMDAGVIPEQARAIRDDLDEIGIELTLRSLPWCRFFGDPSCDPDPAGSIHDPYAQHAMGIAYPWGQDYPEGGGWFTLFERPPTPGFIGGNTSLLGASPSQLREWGYRVTSVPSVDDRLQACLGLRGVSRTQCWAELDQYLTTEIVSRVPYLFLERALVVSERVVAYSFDQFTAFPGARPNRPRPRLRVTAAMSASIVKRAPLFGVVTILLLAAACTGGDRSDGSPPPVDEPPRGGTLRLAIAVFLPRAELDPQRAVFSLALTRCCVHRTLYSYNGRPTGEGGAELRPDLATGIPVVSSDGLRWTFRLRGGLRYAPPFEETEIVAADLVRALEREARVGQEAYAYHYSVIHGFDDYGAGDADSIVGLETPDDHTLVVELDEPASDLAYRLSLPAAAPLPEGAAEGHDEDYARFVVASGPYMVEGSDRLDFSLPPAEQEPLSGYEPPELGEDDSLVTPGSLTLVRNPSWESSSDGLRAAYVDRMEFILGGDEEEMARDVDGGELDLVYGSDSGLADQAARYRQDPELSEQVFVDTLDVANYITMNLAVPPFDDVHVRRAVNLAIDKAPLLELISQPPFGPFGTSSADVATHIGPDGLEGSLLQGFDPYPFDPAAAREEMRLSGYDRDGDGQCEASACQGILALVLDSGAVPDQARAIRDDLASLGIELDLEQHDEFPSDSDRGFYPLLQDPSRRIPMGIGAGWGQDFPSGSGWFPPLFGAAGLESFETFGYTSNHSLLGATPRQLRGWGYSVTSVPSVEDRLGACAARWGSAHTECWAEFDQYLMTEVVPWVPYMFFNFVQVVSERVAAYSFDQFGGQPALDRIALAPGSE